MTVSVIRLIPIVVSMVLLFGAEPVRAADADYLTRSGRELFGNFCASCHGDAGRGNGRVAQTFPNGVPDLSLIARRHDGVFPRELVERIIDGRHVLAAHGTRTMPVWGEVLSYTNLGDPEAERAARIAMGRLADYLSLLQRSQVSAGAPVTSEGDKTISKSHGRPEEDQR